MKKKNNTNKHSRKNMKGGAFSQQERQQLQNIGFVNDQIVTLGNLGVSFNEVMQKVNVLRNEKPNDFNDNLNYMTEQIMIELLNENIFENDNISNNQVPQGTMNFNDISDISENTTDMSDNSGYTTNQTIGGKKYKRKSKKRRRQQKNKRKTRKYRK